MARAPQKKKPPSTLEDAPIGMGPDGLVITVDKDAPPFRPKIVDADGNEIELGEDD